MAETSMIGTRIRERRVLAGLRQSELARRVGISPSYLNLIEHNRRRIGGKTLLKLAETLQVEPSLLSEGAEATLIAGLREAAGDGAQAAAEVDRIEEFAGRFPGWARLLVELHRDKEGLERTVKTLTDRLEHDPHLADSLHEVISTVTAIRATASILEDDQNLEPDWQRRFHRNISEDSRRLAEGAEALVHYLEDAPDTEADIKSPQDELHAFLSDNGFHFPSLEEASDRTTIAKALDGNERLESEAARVLARTVLLQYAEDAARMPLREMLDAVARLGLAPDALAAHFDAPLNAVFRRLAALPEEAVGPVGLVICDASGTLIFRKPIAGFAIPRTAGACTLWPLYQVLGQPRTPLKAVLRQAGRGDARVLAFAATQEQGPAAFDAPPMVRAHMLVVPDSGGDGTAPVRDVGTNCRVCPLPGCTARREPSIFLKGF